MRQGGTRELFAYWNCVRKGRAAPERSEIDPAAIRNVLADTFVLEIDAACSFPLRLCGSRLNALWLGEQKGRSFLSLWDETERRGIMALILTVLDGVNPVIAGVSAAPPGRTPMNFELLLLPLRHNGKTHARLLGCLTPLAREPWFGLVASDKLALKSMRVIGPAHNAESLPLMSSSEDTGNIAQPLGRRGHLTIYAGGGEQHV